MKPASLIATLAVAFSAVAHAQTAPLVDGEVRKIDKQQAKITLKHGPIPNLQMDGMTMIFRVSDVKLLDTVKQGDKVKFTADKVNGAFIVTSIQAAK